MASDTAAFNLRHVVTEEAATKPFFLSRVMDTSAAAPTGGFFTTAPAAVSGKSRSGLKFDFTSLKQAEKPPSLPLEHSVANIPDLKSTQFRNPFEQPRDTSKQADVMRLTTMVDDLQTRLKKSSDRAQAAETQLTKTHQCLVAERQNAASRAKAVNAEIGTAHVTEAALRVEIAKANKVVTQSVSSEKFESAVSATLVAAAAAEKTRRDMSVLKKQQVDSESKMSLMAQELVEVHSKNSAVETRYSSAVKERDSATTQQEKISAELDQARFALVEAHARASKFEDQLTTLQSTHDATLAQMQLSHGASTGCGILPVEPAIKMTDQHEEEEEADKTKKSDTTEAADDDSDADEFVVTPTLPPPTPPEEAVEARAVSMPSGALRERVRSRVPDPIKMYAKYHVMRQRLSDIQTQINSSPVELPRLIEVRDVLYTEARVLKAKYDTIFGTVDGAHAKKDAEKENAPQVEASAEEEHGASALPRFRIFGDEPPDYRVPFGSTMAHKMSIRCPLGGAVPEGHRDISVDIGSYPVSPISISAEPESETDPEATGDHDSAGDMVNAVITDLTLFLKDVKNKSAMEAQPR
jgi:hypothetical protein